MDENGKNAEKRCNFSKLLDFNLVFNMIIPDIYLIFDSIFNLISNLIFTEPPPNLLPAGRANLLVEILTAEMGVAVRRHDFEDLQKFLLSEPKQEDPKLWSKENAIKLRWYTLLNLFES